MGILHGSPGVKTGSIQKQCLKVVTILTAYVQRYIPLGRIVKFYVEYF